MKTGEIIRKNGLAKAFILLLSFLMLSIITSAIPNSLTLQGKLTNTAGVSQQGTFNFTFRIYDAATDGNQLWASINQSVATDANGVYDVILQNISLSFANQLYLGIAVAGDNESTPRINLTSSPYSFRANVSEDLNANNSYVVTNLSIKGNATIGNGLTTLAVSTQSFNLTTLGNIYSAGNLSIAGNTFFVNSLTGYVGIGTTSPNYALQVQGGVNLSNSVYVQNNGNVGIGTTAPQNKLEVIGAVTVAGTLNASSINTTGNSYFATLSGNVGIGTTNPNSKLTVAGNVNISGNLNVSGITNISNDLYVTGNTVIGDSTSDTVEVNAQVASHLIPNNNARNLGSPANFWHLAYIDQLTVNNLTAAATNISGTGFPSFTINANYTGNDQQDVSLIFERGSPIINAVLFWDSTSKRFDMNFPLNIEANNNLTVDTTTLFVDGSIHKVGIGTTSPTQTLTVMGDINATGAIFGAAVNITSGGLNLLQGKLGVNTTTSTQTLEVLGTLNVTSQNTRSGDLFVASSGNVGIGTTSPDNQLTIVGNELTANAILHINASDNFNKSVTNVMTLDHVLKNPVNSTGGVGVSILFRATDNASQLYNIGNISAILYNSTNGSQRGALTFSTSNSSTGDGAVGHSIERMRIDGNGNVGIGTSSPNDALEVVGNVRVSGSLNATSINASTILQNNNQVQTVNAIFNLANYSTEYSSTGWKRSNTTDYLGGINGTILNGITNQTFIDTIITSRNQSWLDRILLNINISGFPFSNFQLSNVSNNTLTKGDNTTTSLWNVSGSNIYPREITGNLGIGTTTPTKALSINGTLNAVTIDPSAVPNPVINTTGNNLTISSASGSVIIRLG